MAPFQENVGKQHLLSSDESLVSPVQVVSVAGSVLQKRVGIPTPNPPPFSSGHGTGHGITRVISAAVMTLSVAGFLVMSCNNALFVELIDFLLTSLAKNASTSTTRTYIQCVGAIRYSRHSQVWACLNMVLDIVRL